MKWTILSLGLFIWTCCPSSVSLAQDTESHEARLIELINQERAARNLPILRYEPRLTLIARTVARAVHDGHQIDNLGKKLDQMLKAKGYPNRVAGARYATTLGTVEDVIQDWIRDREEESFILSPDTSEIGVAYQNARSSRVADIAPNIWAVIVADPARPAPEGWADRVVLHVNMFRAEHGLSPLTRNPLLDQAARGHSRDMLARDFFAHVNPDGETAGQRAIAAGYRGSLILENLAIGQRTPREAVFSWKRSKDGHREAMLNEDVTEIGVGYIFAPFDPGQIHALHYWSLSLGKPR